jgi:hypothetical protein
VNEDEKIGTQFISVQGRAIGQFNFVAQYGLISIDAPWQLKIYLLNQNTDYIFVQGDRQIGIITNIPLYCIYKEENIGGFIVGD